MSNKIYITGRGLITPLGNGLEANEEALRTGRSGVVEIPEFKEMGMESYIAGRADEDPPCGLLDPKTKRFTSANSRMAVAAAEEALGEAGLSKESVRGRKIAVILGCAGSAYEHTFIGGKAFRESGKVKKVTPFTVPRVMPSSGVANISLLLGLKGESYDVSSACVSGLHAIIVASRLIQSGEYDMVISGGCEEINWVHVLGFDAMHALSRKYNDRPQCASRPFDRDRDGFVIASGAGIIILESERHAVARGARPISVISGFAANSNGEDMVIPISASSCEVMRNAVESAGLSIDDIGYVNTHGTSTPMGDPVEMEAIRLLFGGKAGNVPINSTKSLTGHMIGATGAVETIFCSLMIEKGFISPSMNIENLEPGLEWADIVRTCRTGVSLKHALNNSFGFGGTNASLIVSAP